MTRPMPSIPCKLEANCYKKKVEVKSGRVLRTSSNIRFIFISTERVLVIAVDRNDFESLVRLLSH